MLEAPEREPDGLEADGGESSWARRSRRSSSLRPRSSSRSIDSERTCWSSFWREVVGVWTSFVEAIDLRLSPVTDEAAVVVEVAISLDGRLEERRWMLDLLSLIVKPDTPESFSERVKAIAKVIK